MRIESIQIKNYRLFRDVTFDPLQPVVLVVGANGSGKSTLFDVLSFLKESLTESVDHALDRRGGFSEVLSRGEAGPIGLSLTFLVDDGAFARYHVEIEAQGRAAIIRRERLILWADGGPEWPILDFESGIGTVLKVTSDGPSPQPYELADASEPALAGIGRFKAFPDVRRIFEFITSWQISDLQLHQARNSTDTRQAEHLAAQGENVAQVALYMAEHHPERYQQVLEATRRRVPDVSQVEAKHTEDGRLVLRFHEAGFKNAFTADRVSDGTLKMFTYLVMLYDPEPHPLLAVEEPENFLYPELMPELSDEFHDYARRGGQVFVTTHSPEFLNGFELDEIFCLLKRQGFTSARRASDSELVRGLVAEGDKPGALWRQGILEGAGLV